MWCDTADMAWGEEAEVWEDFCLGKLMIRVYLVESRQSISSCVSLISSNMFLLVFELEQQ